MIKIIAALFIYNFLKVLIGTIVKFILKHSPKLQSWLKEK